MLLSCCSCPEQRTDEKCITLLSADSEGQIKKKHFLEYAEERKTSLDLPNISISVPFDYPQ